MMWLKTNESFAVQIYGERFDSQPVLEPISASAAIECRSEVRFSILPKCDVRYRKVYASDALYASCVECNM